MLMHQFVHMVAPDRNRAVPAAARRGQQYRTVVRVTEREVLRAITRINLKKKRPTPTQ
jgi:hypothetical protein